MEELINLDLCKTPEDVTVSLAKLADVSNQSIAHAIRAQIQVIKYISSPSLHGSTFDLFFKHLKNALRYADEESKYEIKDRAAIMINNFFFFMKAKVDWEIAVNRKEYEDLLIEASQDMAENILRLSEVAGNTAMISQGDITSLPQLQRNISHLAKVFISKDDKNGLIHRGVRLVFKNKRAKEKQREFCKTLDRLAEKLNSNYDVIGRNNLIAGLIQNYRNDLIEYHSNDWNNLKTKASWLKHKSWVYPLTILGIGGGIGVLIWLIRWIISWFSDFPEGWAAQQWIWTGIIVVGAAVASFLRCVVKRKIILRKIGLLQKEIEDYYDDLIEKFEE